MCLPRVIVPPPHSMPVTGRCNLFKKVWRDTLKLSSWHIKALEAMPIDWISPPETNRPFDSAIRYPVGAKERPACSAALGHYLKIGDLLVHHVPGLLYVYYYHTQLVCTFGGGGG